MVEPHRGLAAFVFGICLILPTCAFAMEQDQPPTKTELAEITPRGKLIAQYDKIAWHATDLVEAQHPATGSVLGYVAERKGDDWIIVFGRLNEPRDGLLIEYQVRTKPAMAESNLLTHSPNQIDRGDLFHEFLSMDTARADFGKQARPYNDAVLPTSNGQWFVYFYPAQTNDDIFPMGGDVRYLMSADGKSIVEKRQLHKSILERKNRMPDGGKTEAGYHTHILSDIPEDIDVAYVLMCPSRVPEYVASAKFVYRVEIDGTVAYLGRTEEVVGKQK